MARNIGKRPHELTLELFAQNASQTPSEIDAFVKNGPYSSKHIWFLRKLGHDISVNKQGRTVVSYTYNGPGTSTAVVPKPVKAAKPAKVAKPKAVKTAKVEKTDEQIKAANLAKMQAVTAKMNKVKQKAAAKKIKRIDYVEKELGSTGEIATSFSIDNGWDSIDGVDLKKII
jgi:hypothetical protein